MGYLAGLLRRKRITRLEYFVALPVVVVIAAA